MLSLFGRSGQRKTRQTCYYRQKRPLSVSICHVESDPITVTSGQVYYELQLSGGILRSEGRLTEVFSRRSFTRVAPRDVFRPVLYHVSHQLRDKLKSLCNMDYFLPKVQVCLRRVAALLGPDGGGLPESAERACECLSCHECILAFLVSGAIRHFYLRPA